MTSPCKEAVASSDSVAFPLFTVKAQLQGVQAIVEDLGSTLEDLHRILDREGGS